MIESLFIMMFIVGLIIFLLGIKEDSIIYQIISMFLFLILVGQSIYITVPFIAATNATNYTILEHQYLEPGLGAFCLVFVLTDVILIVVEFMDLRRRKRGPMIPGG